MEKLSARQLIEKTLKEKSCLKQDVFEKTKSVFGTFKNHIKTISEELRSEMDMFDKRIQVGFKSRGKFDAELRFAGDVLLFHMHSNIFDIPRNSPHWNTSYLEEDRMRSFCGIINIYNFLSDSLKYNRDNDSGYLVGRIFINKELHFFVEGKRQLGVLYNDFINAELTSKKALDIIESSMLYALDFDLLVPPYDNMKEVSVYDIREVTNNLKIKTGKRLGFQFQADNENFK